MHFLRRSHHPAAAPTLAAPQFPAIGIAIAAAAASYGAAGAVAASLAGVTGAAFAASVVGAQAAHVVTPARTEDAK